MFDVHVHVCGVQWNQLHVCLCILDTFGSKEVSRVVMYASRALGRANCVLFIDVSSFQGILSKGFHCMTLSKGCPLNFFYIQHMYMCVYMCMHSTCYQVAMC